MQRVMVVQTGSVFCESVQRLLAGANGLEVIEGVPGDEAELVQAIQRIQPDVVVMAGKVVGPDEASRLVMSLNSCPRWRVIIVDEDDCLARIYARRQIAITQSVELLDLIRSE